MDHLVKRKEAHEALIKGGDDKALQETTWTPEDENRYNKCKWWSSAIKELKEKRDKKIREKSAKVTLAELQQAYKKTTDDLKKTSEAVAKDLEAANDGIEKIKENLT